MTESPSLSSPSPLSLFEGEAAEVMFRAPHSATYTHLVQHAQPRTFRSLHEVPACSGYLIVPFCVSAEAPIVLIEPDETRELPLEVATNAAHYEVGDDADLQRTRYAEAFRTAHESLQHGKVEKVVLSRRLNLRWQDEALRSPERLFFKACQDNPNCFVTLWNTKHTGAWLVASPEPLLEKSNHTWGSVALAGTMPHGEGTENEWSEKNVAEQAIVADFIHEQLAACADHIEQSPTFSLVTGKLQHICTRFRFTLSSPSAMFNLLKRLHPTPAVCGMPREAALHVIEEAESQTRRYYAGFSGPLDLHGETRLYVSLRCMEFTPSTATLYAGGGIMPESREEDEWEETCRKMQPMIRCCNA